MDAADKALGRRPAQEVGQPLEEVAPPVFVGAVDQAGRLAGEGVAGPLVTLLATPLARLPAGRGGRTKDRRRTVSSIVSWPSSEAKGWNRWGTCAVSTHALPSRA